MKASVANTSASSYSSGWKCWLEFATRMRVSPYPNSVVVNELGLSPAVEHTLGFCAFALLEKHLSPKTICGYLSAVAYHFKIAFKGTDFLLDPAVFMARAGMKRLFVQRKTSSKRTLPFTLDMVLRYKTWITVLKPSAKELGHFTAMCLAFINLLRRSEYIPTKADHFLRGEDVSFVLLSGEIIPAWKIKNVQTSSVTDVIFFIRSSKMNQEGFKFVYSRGSEGEIDICEIALNWALFARFRATDPFLSARNENGVQIWIINPKEFTVTIRALAASFGFTSAQCKAFKIHSLRYGGASTMEAAGLDDAAIQVVGRWKSLAFLQYIRAAQQVFNRTQKALTNSLTLCAANVRLLN
jgi:hypothetical protein